MTTVDIPPKIHKKLKREAFRRNIDLKDVVAEKLSVFAIVALFTVAIGFSAAYAFDETVQLPSADYSDKNCRAVIWETSDWEFSCTWQYGEKSSFIDTRNGKVIPLDEESDTPFIDLMRDITIYLDEQIELKAQDDSTPSMADELSANPIENLDPEVRRALNKLGICQFGDGNWAAFVGNYTREVPAELPIFTSGLDKQRVLGQLAKNFEECKGKTEYPWLSQQYENAYLADLLGLDRQGRDEVGATLDDRRLYEEQRIASAEDIAAEAERVTYPEWYVNPYSELEGINRGNPEPIVTDLDAYNEYISFKAGQIITAQDYENLLTELKEIQCSVYGPQYDYKVRTYIENGETITDYSDFPEWLGHCHE